MDLIIDKSFGSCDLPINITSSEISCAWFPILLIQERILSADEINLKSFATGDCVVRSLKQVSSTSFDIS